MSKFIFITGGVVSDLGKGLSRPLSERSYRRDGANGEPLLCRCPVPSGIQVPSHQAAPVVPQIIRRGD